MIIECYICNTRFEYSYPIKLMRVVINSDTINAEPVCDECAMSIEDIRYD